MADRLIAFQRNGGLIVADEFLTPAIAPDIRLNRYTRTRKADVDKTAIQAQAAALRKELDPFYRRYADSSNPDVVVRVRQAGTTDYLFAVNDRRTFGDYVGQHGLVMEKGLPTSATLSVARSSGCVYDLVAVKRVPAVVKDGQLRIDREFGPADGTLLMITERAVSKVKLDTPPGAQLGQSVAIRIAVLDEKGGLVDAVIPLQVEISDSNGKPAEFSGYYGAKGGHAEIRIDLAANDAPGSWRVRARELASGLTGEAVMQVER